MGFHINKKVADKKATTGAKATFQEVVDPI